jgi:cytochrome c556
MKKTALTAITLAAALASSAPAWAADETNPTIVHRQAIFKVAAGHMGGLKAALFLNGPMENVTYHAEGLLSAFQHHWNPWAPGSEKGETKAKPEIWSNKAKFDEAGQKAGAAAKALVEAAKSGDKAKATDAFKAMGGACKNCHDDFRKE